MQKGEAMPTVLWLLLAAPLIELWFIIRVGATLGAVNTIVLLVVAGILGMHLLRRQSLQTLLRVDQRLQTGELPAEEILEGFVLTLAALCLVIPGFITDVLAIPLLVPPLRRWVVRRYLHSRHFHQHYPPGPGGQPRGETIEGEWRREDDSRLR